MPKPAVTLSRDGALSAIEVELINFEHGDELAGAVAERIMILAEAALAQRADDKAGLWALDRLRATGWMVAVHNDYRLGGEFHTFWLFTHPDGRYVKGEGKTDDQACAAALEAALGDGGM